MVRLVFVAAVLVSLCLSCLGGPEEVRVGTEGAYEPYNFLDDAGDDVFDGTVAAQVATIRDDHLSATGATLVEYELAEQVIEAVLNGEADTALVDREFAHENIAANSGIGIGVREEDGELREKLDAAISAMKDDGSLNTLIRKWFDEDADTF